MGTHEYPLWLDNTATYPAGLDRMAIQAACGQGVLGLTDFKVSQRGAGANLSVDIAIGRAVVPESGANGWRSYLIALSGTVDNFTMPAAPAGGTNRYDTVYAIARDTTNGGAANDWIFGVVQGAGSGGTPVISNPPAGGLRLADVLRTGGTSSVVTADILDNREFAMTGSPASCVLWRTNATVSIATGITASNAITFDTIHQDNRGMGNLGTHATYMEILENGVYTVTGGIRWQASSPGERRCFVGISKNTIGGRHRSFDKVENSIPAGSGQFAQFVTFTNYLVVGDRLYLGAAQSSGATLNFDNTLLGTLSTVAHLSANRIA